jgi:hypothetical protein
MVVIQSGSMGRMKRCVFGSAFSALPAFFASPALPAYKNHMKWTEEADKQDGPAVPISTGNADEDARIQAMFAQNADNWEQMQEDMSL